MKNFARFLPLALLLLAAPAPASSWFIGYELGEMAFNDFQHIAGEIGLTLDNNHTVRMAYLNIALSEKHLSSDSAQAVEGDNVEGLWRGAEFFYDIPMSKNLTWAPSLGYHDSKYEHTQLSESVRRKSASVGLALSYGHDNLFGVKNLYWRFSFPVRYYFNAMPRTNLGDSVVRGGAFGYNPWIYLGYYIR